MFFSLDVYAEHVGQECGCVPGIGGAEVGHWVFSQSAVVLDFTFGMICLTAEFASGTVPLRNAQRNREDAGNEEGRPGLSGATGEAPSLRGSLPDGWTPARQGSHRELHRPAADGDVSVPVPFPWLCP